MEEYKKAKTLNTALQQFRKNGAYKRYTKELSDADLAVLFAIKFADGKIKLTDIAVELELTLPAVTHKVNDLEERNLLVKKVSTTDKRVVNLELTKESLNHLNEIVGSYYKPLFTIMDRLGHEDANNFLRLLNKINNFGKISK